MRRYRRLACALPTSPMSVPSAAPVSEDRMPVLVREPSRPWKGSCRAWRARRSTSSTCPGYHDNVVGVRRLGQRRDGTAAAAYSWIRHGHQCSNRSDPRSGRAGKTLAVAANPTLPRTTSRHRAHHRYQARPRCGPPPAATTRPSQRHRDHHRSTRTHTTHSPLDPSCGSGTVLSPSDWVVQDGSVAP